VTGGCRAEASRLLDFYVNGTLRGQERARVAEHIETCVACAREVAEIEGIENLLSEAGSDPAERPVHQPHRSRWLLPAAAAAIVVALLAVWIGERPGAPPTMEAGRVVTIDLGAGAPRGEPRPTAAIAADVAFVEVLLFLTVEPEATYTLRLYDPRGGKVLGPAPVGPWDAFGTTHQRLPVELFATDGEYRLEVEESPVAGAPRFYDYVLSVAVER